MNPNTVPELGTCHVMLARDNRDNPSDDIDTCHIWMHFRDENRVREWLDGLRPFLHPGTAISVTKAGLCKPMIEEGFPLPSRVDHQEVIP